MIVECYLKIRNFLPPTIFWWMITNNLLFLILAEPDSIPIQSNGKDHMKIISNPQMFVGDADRFDINQ